MANRRMFSKEIIGSDQFLDLPVSSRELYFQLGMYADDDGFVAPKKVVRMVSASDDDIKVLITRGFVIPFESGVIVIRHWKANNYIQSDRYTPTIYTNELKLACEDSVYKLDTQYRLGKVRLEEKSISSFKKQLNCPRTANDLLKNYLNGDRQHKPYFSGNLIVESPAGSKKLGFWKDGEFYEFAGKLSEIEWK